MVLWFISQLSRMSRYKTAHRCQGYQSFNQHKVHTSSVIFFCFVLLPEEHFGNHSVRHIQQLLVLSELTESLETPVPQSRSVVIG